MKYTAHLLDKTILMRSLQDCVKMLDPRVQITNPVMFVTFLGACATSLYLFFEVSFFNVSIMLWLWFTVLFANFAQAVAENRGKAQATSLRQMNKESFAKKVLNDVMTKIPASELKQGDIVICEVGDIIPADGDVIEGIATVDESAITGELSSTVGSEAWNSRDLKSRPH